MEDIYEQALAMAQKRESLFGGTAVVQQYEFKEEEASKALKIQRFDGPIANDGVAYLLGRYEEGSMELRELAREKALGYLKRI